MINAFVEENGVADVIEFGCGDGRQLQLARYPQYVGIDVSPSAVELCNHKFENDETKSFILLTNSADAKADLALSLDVIFHLVEDSVFDDYMDRLFGSARRFVIVYSSNVDERAAAKHVRHRKFTEWVSANRPDFALIDQVANPYSFDPASPDETSFAEFFVFERRALTD